MMVHSLTPAATTLKLPIPKNTTLYPRILVCCQVSTNQTQDQSLSQTRISRRNVAVGLVSGAVGVMDIGRECRDARAAGKRPPPPPPKEKKDPSVTGVVAKYLASKKRKEAMKDAVAKLRERGKPVDHP